MSSGDRRQGETTALTPQLLRARTELLFKRCIVAGGNPEEIVFEIVRCDGCGHTHNLLDGHPVGWRTRGDLDTGFVDHCRSCSC